jgi:thiamine-phosphate pyrophosphorylase
MKIVIISDPKPVAKEALLINQLFDCGLQHFHLRKPLSKKKEIANLIQTIGSEYHPRISLHSKHALVEDYQIGGIHLKSKEQRDNQTLAKKIQLLKPAYHDLRVSTSFHDLRQIKDVQVQYDYAFLSPVFNSISKEGYRAGFDFLTLKKEITATKIAVIALGGCHPKNLSAIKEMGFSGAAFLGFIWQSCDPVDSYKQLQEALSINNST